MSRYHHQKNTYKKLRRYKRAHKGLVTTLSVFILSAVLLGFWVVYFDNTTSSPDPVVVSQGFNNSLTRHVENEYFSFSAQGNWQLQTPDPIFPDRYIYQSKRQNLIERELTVYVGHIPSDEYITQVVPVQIENNRIKVISISPKCGQLAPESKNPVRLTYNQTNFLCLPDSSETIMAASLVKGDYRLPLTSVKQNRHINIGIFYKDLSAQPDFQIFEEILDSLTIK